MERGKKNCSAYFSVAFSSTPYFCECWRSAEKDWSTKPYLLWNRHEGMGFLGCILMPNAQFWSHELSAPLFYTHCTNTCGKSVCWEQKNPDSLGCLAQVTLVWGTRYLKQDGRSLPGWWWEPPLRGSLQQPLQPGRVRLSRLLFCCTLMSSWAVVTWNCSGKCTSCFYCLKLQTKHLPTILAM